MISVLHHFLLLAVVTLCVLSPLLTLIICTMATASHRSTVKRSLIESWSTLYSLVTKQPGLIPSTFHGLFVRLQRFNWLKDYNYQDSYRTLCIHMLVVMMYVNIDQVLRSSFHETSFQPITGRGWRRHRQWFRGGACFFMWLDLQAMSNTCSSKCV